MGFIDDVLIAQWVVIQSTLSKLLKRLLLTLTADKVETDSSRTLPIISSKICRKVVKWYVVLETKAFAFYISSYSLNVNVVIQDALKYCVNRPFNKIWLPSRSHFWRLSQCLRVCVCMHSLKALFCCILETVLLKWRNDSITLSVAVLINLCSLWPWTFFLLCIWLTCSAFLQFIVFTLFVVLSIVKLILHYL